MKNWRTPFLVLLTVFIFWFIKFYLHFPSADTNMIGLILTVASILFGFLAGFFISELWTRYTEIRELQGMRSSSGLNMIKYAEYFFSNKRFEEEFKKSVERSCIADEIVEWDEGHFEIPYYRNIADTFRQLIVKSPKDESYFNTIIERHNAYVEATVKLDTLYRERLFPSEWFILYILSGIIAISVLLTDASHFFFKVVIIAFPAILTLALSIIYDLDKLIWSKETITIEPVQRILDAIGAKRFYLNYKKPFISQYVKAYRTEKDLEGEMKEVYEAIVAKRERG